MSRLHSAAQAVLAMWDRCEIAPHPSSEGAHLAFDELRAALVPSPWEVHRAQTCEHGHTCRCNWDGPIVLSALCCVHGEAECMPGESIQAGHEPVLRQVSTRYRAVMDSALRDGLAEIQQDARRIVMEGLRREMNAQMVAMMYGTHMGRAARSLAGQGDPGPWGLEALEAEARRLAEEEAGR